MAEAEFERITGIFQAAGVPFQVIEHEPVRTSAEAAAARGLGLGHGVKALTLKVTRRGEAFFCVADLPADRKLDSKAARRALDAQEIRFATEEEVLEQTGCERGGVPPLGHARPLPLLVDPRVFDEPEVEFNAGLRTRSVRLESAGLRRALDALGAVYATVCQ